MHNLTSRIGGSDDSFSDILNVFVYTYEGTTSVQVGSSRYPHGRQVTLLMGFFISSAVVSIRTEFGRHRFVLGIWNNWKKN